MPRVGRGRQERSGTGRSARYVAGEVVAAHERGEQRVRVALGRQDQLPVLGEREALGVEAAERVRPAARPLQRRHRVEVDVAASKLGPTSTLTV